MRIRINLRCEACIKKATAHSHTVFLYNGRPIKISFAITMQWFSPQNCPSFASPVMTTGPTRMESLMLASESHVRTIRKPPGDRARIEVECFRKNSGNLRARKLIRFSFREYNGRKVHFRLRADVFLSLFANDFLTFQREITNVAPGQENTDNGPHLLLPQYNTGPV